MYNNKSSELLINNLIDIHGQHHSFIAQHHDQLKEYAYDFSNAYIDQSINLLKDIHSKISQDKSNSTSLASIALIQTLIDNAFHFKATMTHHKQAANIHKQNLRRLALGVMTGFGVMSGTHAANDLSESSTYFEESGSKISPRVVFFDGPPERSNYFKEASSATSVEMSFLLILWALSLKNRSQRRLHKGFFLMIHPKTQLILKSRLQ